MLRNAIPALLLAASVSLLSGGVLAADSPTLHQVYQAAQAGKLDEAQGMMKKVIQEHPNSGKAHYVEAEILAKQGKRSDAERELNIAQRLEPGLPFAKPQSVQELKSRLATIQPTQSVVEGMGGAPTDPPRKFPWNLLLLGIGAIALVIFLVRAMTGRNKGPTTGYPVGTPGPTGQPAVGGGVTPMAPAGGGLGSSLVSGLATGAAVGAGMVAGEALAHHFMDGNKAAAHPAVPPPERWGASSDNDNMGGADFGVADNSSWDDNSSVANSTDLGGDDWS